MAAKKFPMWVEKNCRVCGKPETILIEERAHMRRAVYCSQVCRDLAFTLTRAGKLPPLVPKDKRKGELERQKQNYKPTVWKAKKKVTKTDEYKKRDAEYWRMLRKSYNLEDRV